MTSVSAGALFASQSPGGNFDLRGEDNLYSEITLDSQNVCLPYSCYIENIL